MGLGLNLLRKIIKFKKDYPQFKNFRFWNIKRKGNKLISAFGQAQFNRNYYGDIYFFDFVNKTWEVKNV